MSGSNKIRPKLQGGRGHWTVNYTDYTGGTQSFINAFFQS